jgi:hypothetical protein
VALRAILALPLRAMASLFCGRDGSKPPAGSNQSKDCRLLRGAGFGRRKHHRQPVCLAVFRVVLAREPPDLARSVPDIEVLGALGIEHHPR